MELSEKITQAIRDWPTWIQVVVISFFVAPTGLYAFLVFLGHDPGFSPVRWLNKRLAKKKENVSKRPIE